MYNTAAGSTQSQPQSLPYMLPPPPLSTASTSAPATATQSLSIHPTQSFVNSLPHYSDLYKQSNTTNMYPGRLRIYIHAVEQVEAPSGVSLTAGIVVRVVDSQTLYEWRTDSRFADSQYRFVWPNMNSQYSINNPLDQLLIEIRSVNGDTLIGGTLINADTLIKLR